MHLKMYLRRFLGVVRLPSPLKALSHHESCAFRRKLSTAVPGVAAKLALPAGLDAALSTNGRVLLNSRRVLKVHGDDAVSFLQGLVTSNMPSLTQPGARSFTVFLNHRGRVLYDALVYTVDAKTFLLEVAAVHAESLVKHLTKYKLRARVGFQIETGLAVAFAWGGNALEPWANARVNTDDPRVPGFGNRIIFEAEEGRTIPSDDNAYLLRRILFGISEGPHEFKKEAALPFENNADVMNGVHFRKGCYLGQELTTRTYHTGVIRKRVVPFAILPSLVADLSSVQFSAETPAPPADPVEITTSEGKNASVSTSRIGNVGLALLRMEDIASGTPLVAKIGGTAAGIARPWLPSWWPKLDDRGVLESD